MWLTVAVGPGLMVMLADTDAGSVVTAAQSGARFGYRLLPLEVLLIPILYLVMELTVRLGLTTGKGHAELIKERFGRGWASLSVGILLVTSVGALVTEFAGIAGVGSIVGLPSQIIVPGAAVLLLAVVASGTYRRVEVIGIGLGLFELAFLVAAIRAHPNPGSLAGSLLSGQPLGNQAYLALAAANVGAVVMPWMIFYQQAAILDKGITVRNLRAARVDTAVGAVVTQVIMIAVLVATGASLFHRNAGSLNTVAQISTALTSSLGAAGGRLAFAMGVAGAALIAALVVSLGAAWAFAEVAGRPRSLNRTFRQEPTFYGVFAGAVIVSAVLVLTSSSLVGLAIDVEILNALLLPIVLVFLIVLAWTVLPTAYRLRRWERALLVLATAGVVAMGLTVAVTAL
ncbi:MAG: NRAMP family divalent metal transporter [Candidatus Dormibacteria bacterium]